MSQFLPIRRKADDNFQTDSDGTWAISYGDMITLLLTFFIIFFSTSRNSSNAKGIQQSVLKALSAQEAREEPEALSSRLPASTRVGNEPKNAGIEDFLPKDLGAISSVSTEGKILVTFKELSFFRLGEIDVNSEGMRALEKFAKLYLPYAGQNQLSVRAYTDDVPVKAAHWKRFSDNLELSALRAVAALRVLQRAGIPLHVMKISGWGELSLSAEKLASVQASAQGRGTPMARKVVLVIEPEVRNSI